MEVKLTVKKVGTEMTVEFSEKKNRLSSEAILLCLSTGIMKSELISRSYKLTTIPRAITLLKSNGVRIHHRPSRFVVSSLR